MRYKKFFLIFLILFFTGCVASKNDIISTEIVNVFESLPNDNKVNRNASLGIKALKNNDFVSAHKAFERGIRLNPTNAELHFLNSLTYHIQGLSGNSKMLELAESGYKTSLRFDKSNYWASYFLGHINFDNKKYVSAQEQFSSGLLYVPNNPYFLRALAISAYYSKDSKLNTWAAKKAYNLDPNNLDSLRTIMFSQAAFGNINQAKNKLSEYKKLTYKENKNNYINKLTVNSLSNRINDWEYFHVSSNDNDANVFGSSSDTNSLLPLDGINNNDYNGDDEVEDHSSDNESKSVEKVTINKKESNLPKMVLVDVVILRMEELYNENKGVNLLDGLTSTLTGTLIAYDKISGYASGSGSLDSEFTTISPSFTLVGLEYSLNIFNEGENKVEIIARPSLLAVENKSSKFHSGSVIHVQLSSNSSDGSMVDVPIGIDLNVTPKFHGSDTLEIAVKAERSYLEPLSEKVGFEAFSQTSRTSVDATAVLKYNQTLILSGLTLSENSVTQSGVPILQDIPIIQYLFSNKQTSKLKKSIIILLTPRKAKYFQGDLHIEDSKKAFNIKKRSYYKNTNRLKKKERINSNIDSVLAHFKNKEFYEQFKKGDLVLDKWYKRDTIIGSLDRILGFLYY